MQIKLGGFGFGHIKADWTNVKVTKLRVRTHVLIWCGRWGLSLDRKMDEDEPNMYGGGNAEGEIVE